MGGLSGLCPVGFGGVGPVEGLLKEAGDRQEEIYNGGPTKKANCVNRTLQTSRHREARHLCRQLFVCLS